jgi:hypothetical protein
LFIAYLFVFKCMMFFSAFTSFYNNAKKKQEKVCEMTILWLNITLTSSVCWVIVDSSEIIECKIDFVFQIFAILFFSAILILHWNDHVEWLSLQFAHLRRFINALQMMSLCDSKQTKHRFSYRQTLIMCSYRWQLKHCLIRQLLIKSSHVTCVYSFIKSFLINRFDCFAL